jgi:hypothetical protein
MAKDGHLLEALLKSLWQRRQTFWWFYLLWCVLFGFLCLFEVMISQLLYSPKSVKSLSNVTQATLGRRVDVHKTNLYRPDYEMER